MFQTFTGSSRKPRQVNLSGSRPNPFAKASALQNAQQERENRQRERDRLHTARLLQRRWRGHVSRKRSRQEWRREFDEAEMGAQEDETYESQEVALMQLQRILHFADLRHGSADELRFQRYMQRLSATLQSENVICAGGPWPMAYLRLQKLVLAALRTTSGIGVDLKEALTFVELLGRQIPELVGRNGRLLYGTMAAVIEANLAALGRGDAAMSVLVEVLMLPLFGKSQDKVAAYQALACEFLVSSAATATPFHPRYLDALSDAIDPIALSTAVTMVMSSVDYSGFELLRIPSRRYNLLGAFIYMHRRAHRHHGTQAYASHKEFVHAISSLLLSLAAHLNSDNTTDDFDTPTEESLLSSNAFAQEQMLTLVNQESIQSLLFGATNSAAGLGSPKMNSEAKQLASYALTLLRFFPRRADEIRMWLYMGSTARDASSTRLPAIKFFWQAARSSMVFDKISLDARSVIRLLKPQPAWDGDGLNGQHTEWVQDDWRVILIFLELYTFVLKLMDDEEFFSGSSLSSSKSTSSSWARTNALPLDDVKDLTLFLKNLGFIMYFNAKDIVEESQSQTIDSANLTSYFKVASPGRDELSDFPMLPRTPETALAGLAGISVDYVKGLVTGLLRMVHERDSRRKFLPTDHWLMTSLFEMDSFIPDVVAEEENRHRIENGDDELGDDYDDFEDGSPLVGTARQRNLRHQQRLERQQKLASRRRYLQAVAPRSEILQNMPFFIPFTTRVEIFREFVKRDQFRRREGLVDAELWRINMMNQSNDHNHLARHTAVIRRGNEFEDAFDQFYPLREGLKEPIQITFMDKFGQQEAGIDGGGVTKEFLTSVTNQAFAPVDGYELFKENEQRLLYPNPTALDENKAVLAEMWIEEGSPEFRRSMTNVLQRYEFLGRIVGKCLYEGILVDITFAPFFLLKWALTGGDGAAPRESSYRANLNDLRDIDEELYRGLIQLKNYPGNVQDDLSLDFTITDTFPTTKNGPINIVTKDLKPGGANIPVTNENRLVYISYVARYRLVTLPYHQTQAFLRGLSAIISPSWLSMFNAPELQTLISGTAAPLNISDLRHNTNYGGVYALGHDGIEHPTVQIFWRVMQSLSDSDRRAVLKFVTSTPRAPLLGFGSLNPRFSIRDSGADESRLPSTSTCVNLLKLPRYSDEATLREKLLYAVNSGAGFDLS